jgi:hypothetical protein
MQILYRINQLINSSYWRHRFEQTIQRLNAGRPTSFDYIQVFDREKEGRNHSVEEKTRKKAKSKVLGGQRRKSTAPFYEETITEVKA